MTAIDNAKLAIDANFDSNGVDAVYFSAYPNNGILCRVLPDQADVEFGMEQARVMQARAVFVLRGYAEGITPAAAGVLKLGEVAYRIEEAPSPDNLRLTWRMKCVKR